MLSIFNRYSGFIKDAMTLVGSTSSAKVIGIALVPIISRLYDPDDFGVVTVVLSLAMIFGAVSSLRYEQAIVLPENDHAAMQLTKLSLYIVVLITTLLFIAAFVFNYFFSTISLIDGLGVWIYLVPVLTLLIGVSDVLTSWCSRQAHYKSIGMSEVAVSVSNSGSRIALGAVFGSSIFGLMFGVLIGYLSKIYVLFRSVKNINYDKVRESNTEEDLQSVAVKYKQFPIIAAPTAIINTGFQKLPVILLGIIFLPEVVGLYAMASRLSRLPIDVICLPVRRIYMQRVAKLRNNNQAITGVLIKTTVMLFALGFIPFLILAIFGEELFGFVLGEKWSQAGIYASMLVPWLYSMFILSPSATNYIILEKQGLYLRTQIYIGVLGAVVFLIGHMLRASPEELLLYFSVVAMLANILLFVVTMKITIKADHSLNQSISG